MIAPCLFEDSCSAAVVVNDDGIILKFVFIEELIGVPLVWQVEFCIDLVLGVAPVAKDPYRLMRPNEGTSCSIF